MRKKLWLSLSLLALSSCGTIDIPVTESCVVAGTLDAGMICAKSSGETRDMTLEESVNWLSPDVTTGKGSAVCQSSIDWNAQKTALEEACRMLGRRCSKPSKAAITQMKMLLILGTPHSPKPASP